MQAWPLIRDAVRHFINDDGWAMSSHVALSLLMALFPFLIFVAAVAGAIGQDALVGQVTDILFRTWPDAVASPIVDEVHKVVAGADRHLLTVSAVVAVYLASNGVEAARTALNRAYRVVDRRSILRVRAQSLLIVLGGTLVALALAAGGLFATRAFDGLAHFVPALTPIRSFLTLSSLVAGALGAVGALVTAHVWLPAGRPPWAHLLPGIALTLVLWGVAVWAFAFYLRTFSSMATTYAGLAGVFTAVFFLYVVAVVFIFGAEFNAALWKLRGEGRR